MCPCLVRTTALKRRATRAGKSTLSRNTRFPKGSLYLCGRCGIRRHILERGHVAAPETRDATPATEAKEPVRSRLREGASGAPGRTLPSQTCPRLLSTAPEIAGSWSAADAQLVEEFKKNRNLSGLRELSASRRTNQRRWGGARRISCRPRSAPEDGNQANQAPTPEAGQVTTASLEDNSRTCAGVALTCNFKGSGCAKRTSTAKIVRGPDVLFHFDFPACRPTQIIVPACAAFVATHDMLNNPLLWRRCVENCSCFRIPVRHDGGGIHGHTQAKASSIF